MDDGRPLASIIVNNYNYGRFLGEAVESALAQTYTPLEVIVVDDGSTDESREVIARYGDRIVALLKENGGQGSAFNAGFAASRGEVVLFLDSDDVLLPTAVAQAVERLSEPGAVKVHWPLWEVDAQGRRTGGVQPVGVLPDGDVRSLVIREGPAACCTPPTSANAWSRWFLTQVLPMPENEFRINSDGYLVTLGWIYGEVRAVPEPQGLYRIHGNNNFASKPKAERARKSFEMHMHRCEALARHVERARLEFDINVWKRRHAWYQWGERTLDAVREIASYLPPGARFILVDDQAWGKDREIGEILAARRPIPFLERNGQYWGHPESSAVAIEELRRLRSEGADYIVFPWFSLWWLEEYPELATYLSAFSRVISSDCVLAYGLRRARACSGPLVETAQTA